MQPIVINRPEIYQKLRSRLGTRSGTGRNAELEMSIQPVVAIDPLLLLSRSHHSTNQGVDSVRSAPVFTVPPGEYWHLNSVSWESVAGADYSLFLWAARPTGENPSTSAQVPITDLWTFSGIGLRQASPSIILRPFDQVGWASLIWVANGGDASLLIAYDLEDCSS